MYPSVSAEAVCAGVAMTPFNDDVVFVAAKVANTARPSDAPTVLEVFNNPEARPACSRGTPAVPATAMGVTASPMPRPMRTKGIRRLVRKVEPGVMNVNQARPDRRHE